MPTTLSHDPVRAPPVLRTALPIAAALAFVVATAWLDGAPKWAGAAWWDAPLRMTCNALPGLLLAFALLAATRRIAGSFLLAFGVQALVYGANALKVKNLAVPLLPADFRMLGQLRHGGGELLAHYIPHPFWLLAACGACVALLVAWPRFERPLLPRRPRRWRLGAAVLLCAALVSLIAGAPFWRGVYNPKALGMQPWSPSATRHSDGVIGALLLFNLNYRNPHRAPDTRAAQALLARYAPALAAAAPPPPANPPDIVVILSESFFDPSILRGWPADADLTPNLHRLQQHGTAGWLHVPTFGGGTIRTEFEVLTGLPLRYFPAVHFPYLQIHQKRIPGIVRLLDAHGYATLAVHGNDPGFWNRTAAFKELGFDRFISIADFPSADAVDDGKYMSDRSFTDELLRQLPDDGPPRFVLGISIEAHGPYDAGRGITAAARAAMPVPAGVTDPQARRELQNYLYHLQHADAQLGRLVDTLAQRKRRTLVLFFGDHLPALVPAFQQAGFGNGRDFLTQPVPYVLLDTAHMDRPEREDTAAWALPGMLLHAAGIADDYFGLTRLVAPQLAALTRAPDAPPAPETARQRQLDEGMRNVADLRLRGELHRYWPAATASGAAHATAVRAAAARP